MWWFLFLKKSQILLLKMKEKSKATHEEYFQFLAPQCFHKRIANGEFFPLRDFLLWGDFYFKLGTFTFVHRYLLPMYYVHVPQKSVQEYDFFFFLSLFMQSEMISHQPKRYWEKFFFLCQQARVSQKVGIKAESSVIIHRLHVS